MEEASTTVSKTTTNWRKVRRASPAGEARTAVIRQAIEDALVLGELRRLRGLSQADLAELLDMSQSRISRIEREQDLYLSTLRRYVEALGGRLEIVAVFADDDMVAIGV